jgi:microcystin-dependent protein
MWRREKGKIIFMKTTDFTHLGGMPGTQQRFDFMQTGYNEAFAAIAKMCGDKTILYGVEVNAGNVSAGWISVNGELIRFIGGSVNPLTDWVVFSTAVTPLTFLDNTIHNVHFDKTATSGINGDVNNGDFLFSELVPLLSLSNIWLAGDVKEKIVTEQYIIDNFDAITGVGLNRERGWQILSMALPDTAGKMFVNRDPNQGSFESVGLTGGEETHTLTQLELPNVSLKMFTTNVNGGGGDTVTVNDNVDRAGVNGGNLDYEMRRGLGAATHGNTSRMGSGQAHNNMPPFYVVLKIIKL